MEWFYLAICRRTPHTSNYEITDSKFPKSRSIGVLLLSPRCPARRRSPRQPKARIEAPPGVVVKCVNTSSRVEVAIRVAIERFGRNRRIVDAGYEAEEGMVTLSSVVARIAPIRLWVNRLGSRRKRKASEGERDEK